MTHLTLVSSNGSHRPDIPQVRTIPTDEFITRRILALTLAETTIGSSLAEAARLLKSECPTSLRRFSDITNRLMFAGIWFIPFDIEDGTPTHGFVANPQTLIKYYPELKRSAQRLNGLVLPIFNSQ